jgi:hypothetical protein
MNLPAASGGELNPKRLNKYFAISDSHYNSHYYTIKTVYFQVSELLFFLFSPSNNAINNCTNYRSINNENASK